MTFVKSKCPLPTRSLRLLRVAVRSSNSALCLHHAHPFVAAAEKKTCLMQRSKGFCSGAVDANILKVQWLCSQLWHVTAANQWKVVEIELLATVGLKRGCQPFSCRCSQNVTHYRKEICWTGLSKESIPAIPFRISKHPLFVKVSGFVSHVEKHRPGHGVVVSKVCYGILNIGAIFWTCFFPFAMRLQCVEIERLATVGWKWVCQRFSCPCSQHVTHCPKEICLTCLSKESIPATPLGNAKHLLTTRSLRLLRAAAHSTSSALCLHHAHPFVAAAEKNESHADSKIC